MIISSFNKKIIVVSAFACLLCMVFGLSSFFQLRHLQKITSIKTTDNDSQIEVITSTQEPVDIGFYGFAMIENGKVEEITATITSKIIQTHAVEGDFVKKNQKILTLERRDIEMSISTAQKTFEKEKLNFEAITKLYDKQLVSKRELNQAKQNYNNAEQVLNKIFATNKIYDIVAPFDGYIARLYAKNDEVAFAGQTKLAKFVSNNDVYLISSLSSDKKRLISQNTSVDIILTEDLNSESDNEILSNSRPIIISADINQIYPTINKISKTFDVRLLIDKKNENYSKFQNYLVQYPSSTLKLFFKTSRTEAFFVPLSSIIYGENDSVGIYIVDENSVLKFVEVSIVKTLINGLFVLPKPIFIKTKTGLKKQQLQFSKILKVVVSGLLSQQDGDIVEYHDVL